RAPRRDVAGPARVVCAPAALRARAGRAPDSGAVSQRRIDSRAPGPGIAQRAGQGQRSRRHFHAVCRDSAGVPSPDALVRPAAAAVRWIPAGTADQHAGHVTRPSRAAAESDGDLWLRVRAEVRDPGGAVRPDERTPETRTAAARPRGDAGDTDAGTDASRRRLHRVLYAAAV